MEIGAISTAKRLQSGRQEPEINITSGYSYTDADTAAAAGRFFTKERYDLGVNFSYQVDIWQIQEMLYQTQKLEWKKSIDLFNQKALLLSSVVFKQWTTLSEIKQRKKLLKEQIHFNEKRLSIIEKRFL